MPDPNSAIARRASTNSSMARTVNRGFRSTPRIASTARLATSRTRPRTSTGSLPKAAEAPITRTCKWLSGAALAAVLFVPFPAAAARLTAGDPELLYVQARAAAMNGDHARAAELLASLAASQSDSTDITKKAIGEAIGAGQMDLALNLVRGLPAASVPTDARLLLVADEIKRHRLDRALSWLSPTGGSGDLTFLAPVLTAWDYAERGNLNQALASLDRITATNLLTALRPEEQAFILLRFKRTADAEPFARKAIGNAGARETQLRLALADGFLAAGDKTRALAMLDGMNGDVATARQRVLAGKQSGQAIDTTAKAYSAVLTAFAADLTRLQRAAPPIGLVQVARYADPQNSSATALLALLLDGQDRTDQALAVLGTIPPNDALVSQARDVQVRILSQDKRLNDAYVVAATAVRQPGAGMADYSRLGDVLEAMKHHDAAADAYGRAVALAKANANNSEVWPLLLLRASSLEEGNRWPEAKV